MSFDFTPRYLLQKFYCNLSINPSPHLKQREFFILVGSCKFLQICNHEKEICHFESVNGHLLAKITQICPTTAKISFHFQFYILFLFYVVLFTYPNISIIIN